MDAGNIFDGKSYVYTLHLPWFSEYNNKYPFTRSDGKVSKCMLVCLSVFYLSIYLSTQN